MKKTTVKEIKMLAEQIPAGKLAAAMGNGKAVQRAVAALRYAGLPSGATDGECNCCGETHRVANLTAAWRGGVPVVVCYSCLHANGLGSL